MARFMLNKEKANNYAFFCPQSRLHLTVSSPVGNANEVTSAIIRGVKSKAIIDLDGVIGRQKTETENKAASAEVPVKHTDEKPVEEIVKTEQPKRGSKKKAATQEEKPEQAAE